MTNRILEGGTNTRILEGGSIIRTLEGGGVTTLTLTHTTDSLLKKFDLTLTHTTDSLLKKFDLTLTHTTDSWLIKTGKFLTYTGEFTKNDAAPQEILLPFTPKAIIFFSSQSVSEEFLLNSSFIPTMGFVDDANTNVGVINQTLNGATTTDTSRVLHTSSAILGMTSGPAIAYRGTVAINPGKFNITWNVANGGAQTIPYLIIGGTDVTGVDVGTFTQSTTNGDQSVAVDSDCQNIINKEGALFLISHGSATNNSVVGNSSINLGFSTEGGTDKGYNTGYFSDDAEANAECYNLIDTTRIIHFQGPTDGSEDGDAYLKDAGSGKITDGTGFNLTWANVDAVARTIGFLVIKGGSWQSGTETTRTTTGTKSTITDFKPEFLLIESTIRTTTGSAGQQDSAWGVGVSDGISDIARGGSENDGLGTSSTGRNGSITDLLVIQDPVTETNAKVRGRIEGSGSFNNHDFTIDYPTTVDASNAYIFNWIIARDFKPRLTHTTDSKLKLRTNINHTTDSFLATAGAAEKTLIHTTDSLLKKLDLILTHTTDSLLKKLDNILTHTTDSLLKKLDKILTHTTDSLLKKLDKLLTNTTNSLLKTVDKILTHPTDSKLKRVDIIKTHTTDSLLVGQGLNHTTNSYLIAIEKIRAAFAILPFKREERHTKRIKRVN